MARRGRGEGTFRRRADGRWEGRWREGDTRLSAYGRTRAEAKQRLAERVERHRREHDLDATDWTVGRFLAWWVDEELAGRVADGRITESTRTSYEQLVRLELTPRLGTVSLSRLGPQHIRRMLTEQRAAGVSDHRRAYSHTVLRTALSCAVRYEMLSGNPARLIEPPKPPKARRPQTTADQARRILDASDGDWRMLWRLMLVAPMRPGEAIAAALDDTLDLDGRVFTVSRNLIRRDGAWWFGDTKGHRSRTVPLPDDVVSMLRAHRKALLERRLALGSAWVGAEVSERGKVTRPWLAFAYEDGSPLHAATLERALTRTCERAGVPRITPHGLRHAAASMLREASVPDAVIQQLGGWSSMPMLDHYTSVLEDAKREAVEALAGRLG